MQLTTVLLAAMAIFVTAQDTSLIPQCAVSSTVSKRSGY